MILFYWKINLKTFVQIICVWRCMLYSLMLKVLLPWKKIVFNSLAVLFVWFTLVSIAAFLLFPHRLKGLHCFRVEFFKQGFYGRLNPKIRFLVTFLRVFVSVYVSLCQYFLRVTQKQVIVRLIYFTKISKSEREQRVKLF